MLKTGFSLTNLEQTAGAAKTMGKATGILRNLERGLKPGAITSDWATTKK